VADTREKATLLEVQMNAAESANEEPTPQEEKQADGNLGRVPLPDVGKGLNAGNFLYFADFTLGFAFELLGAAFIFHAWVLHGLTGRLFHFASGFLGAAFNSVLDVLFHKFIQFNRSNYRIRIQLQKWGKVLGTRI
jgi:hypothetical protein